MGQIAGTLSTFNGPGRVCLSRVAAGKMAPHYGRRIDYTALIGLHQVELLQTMRGCLLIRGSTSTGALLNGLAGGRASEHFSLALALAAPLFWRLLPHRGGADPNKSTSANFQLAFAVTTSMNLPH